MIRAGYKMKLYPWKTYKDEPTKSIPIFYGEDSRGKFVKCQGLDTNVYRGEKMTSRRTGFFYLQIYTEAELKIGEYVTLDEILGFQCILFGKSRIFVVHCTIKEKEKSIMCEEKENSGYEF